MNNFKRILKNKFALFSLLILICLYLTVSLAPFMSPYSPTEDEFRDYFYHPPKFFHFIDQDSHFHLRPFVYPVFIVDRAHNLYSEGRPLCIRIQDSRFDKEEFFIDTIIKTRYAPIIIKNSNNQIIATINNLAETDTHSGFFKGCYSASPYTFQKNHTYTIEYRDINSNSLKFTLAFPVVYQSVRSASKREDNITLLNELNEPASTYNYKVETYPVQFFVRGFEYKLLGTHTTHLFKPPDNGFIFLFGTDQNGRDIFSRTLYGGRISLTIGIIGAIISSLLGLIIGGISGYYGGKIDSFIMRIVEILMSIPALYLILAIRNIVPDEFGKIYSKINLFFAQLFYWKNTAWIFALIIILLVALSLFYILIKLKRRTLHSSHALLLFLIALILLEADNMVRLFISILSIIIPPATTIDSQWVYFYIVIIISMIGWASMARIIRGMVLSIKELDYVTAARATGASDFYILRKHILPQTYRIVIIRATLLIPFYILSEIALSFLGLGIQEPDPSWGNMLQYAQNIKVLTSFPWMLAPGLFLFVTVLSFNFFGDFLSSTKGKRGHVLNL